VPNLENPTDRRNYEDYIITEYFNPYFLSGVKKYIERGDVLQIEDIELFVLNCAPENGFVIKESNVLLKFGFSKEKCLEKINNADNKMAMTLLSLEENLNMGLVNNNTNTNINTNTSPYLHSDNNVNTNTNESIFSYSQGHSFNFSDQTHNSLRNLEEYIGILQSANLISNFNKYLFILYYINKIR
jgi:hypothetical protein